MTADNAGGGIAAWTTAGIAAWTTAGQSVFHDPFALRDPSAVHDPSTLYHSRPAI